MLAHEFEGVGAGPLAQVGVDRDVAAEQALQIERERTVMPRTTPRLPVTRYPGSSKVVVIIASCMTYLPSATPGTVQIRLKNTLELRW